MDEAQVQENQRRTRAAREAERFEYLGERIVERKRAALAIFCAILASKDDEVDVADVAALAKDAIRCVDVFESAWADSFPHSIT